MTSFALTVLLALDVGAGDTTAQMAPPPSPLVLEQWHDGEITCVSSDATCTAVNLYGQDGDTAPPPIQQGEQRTTTVELRNAGSIASSGLELSPGACRNQTLERGAAGVDLCAVVTVAIECATGGTTMSMGPETLASVGQGGSHMVNLGLPAGASATCRLTVTYPDDAPPITDAVRAVQPVTWTLTAPAAPTEPQPPPAPGTQGPAAPPRDPLPVTGGQLLPLALVGLALLVIGGVLHRLSRRHRRGEAEASPSSC